MSGDNYLLTYSITQNYQLRYSFNLSCCCVSIDQYCSVQPCQEETFLIKKSTTLVAKVWTCQDTMSGGQELLNWSGFCCFIYKTTKMTD